MEEEARLIRQVQRTGSRSAAETLIRKYFDEIYAYVHRRTSDRQIAMNITQNVFIAVLQSIESYDPKRANFRTWLYRIARNKTIDHYRSRSAEKRRILSLEQTDIPDEAEFTRRIEAKSLLSSVQRYIDSLETSLQQIFRLKVYGNRTFAQIATMLDMPESTVKTKYYRLVKTLRKEFEDEAD